METSINQTRASYVPRCVKDAVAQNVDKANEGHLNVPTGTTLTLTEAVYTYNAEKGRLEVEGTTMYGRATFITYVNNRAFKQWVIFAGAYALINVRGGMFNLNGAPVMTADEMSQFGQTLADLLNAKGTDVRVTTYRGTAHDFIQSVQL